MKYSIFFAAASAVVASAQVVYNETTGVFTCAPHAPNGAYCAGTSLESNIIIRCTNGIGQPGNCNDNLAGSPPEGVNFAPCYETDPLVGDAVCSNNCIAYPETGGYPFDVPGCASSSSSSSTVAYSTSSLSSSSAVYTPPTYTTTTTTNPYLPPSNTTLPPSTSTEYTTLTLTSLCTTIPGTTITSTYTTVLCAKCNHDTTITYQHPTPTTSYYYPTGTGTGIVPPPANGTVIIPSGTRTPVGPTGTGPAEFTGAASSNTAGGLAAGLGLLVAYLL